MGLFNKWKKKVEVEPYRISAPVAGKVIDIKDTNDQVFNSEALGKGVGIIASEKQITAPIGGQIVSFFPTKHAVGIKTDKGVELLIPIFIFYSSISIIISLLLLFPKLHLICAY